MYIRFRFAYSGVKGTTDRRIPIYQEFMGSKNLPTFGGFGTRRKNFFCSIITKTEKADHPLGQSAAILLFFC